MYMKNYQQTPKQRRLQKKKVELSKRRVAHSTPLFHPRESWTSRKKVNGVPVSVLDHKQHLPAQGSGRWW
jgi:hypothetical protein